MDCEQHFLESEKNYNKFKMWDFPGCPMVKTSPSNAGGMGLIPGQGAGIPHASRLKDQNIEQKQYYNKVNKDFKNLKTKCCGASNEKGCILFSIFLFQPCVCVCGVCVCVCVCKRDRDRDTEGKQVGIQGNVYFVTMQRDISNSGLECMHVCMLSCV